MKTIDLNFEKLNGILPAIIQDYNTDKVLMLGFMNKEAYLKTIREGKVVFFSRTKKRLWMKGEISGNVLQVVNVQSDCDKDTLLIRVIPSGTVCHTGNDTCFGEENKNSLLFLKTLQNLIKSRQSKMPDISYTSSLFNKGVNYMAQKVGEEAVETIIEATNGTNKQLIYESSDLVYHLIVLLTAKGLSIVDILEELQKRFKNNDE